jgi:hypothetical protein
MSKHNFQRSLVIGQAGEALLLELWPELRQTDGRKGDFLLHNGDVLEVKSDSYSLKATKNFFMERWSDFDRKKPGGPWQSLAHGAKYFFYWFPADLTGFLFHTQELVDKLEELEHTLETRFVDNETWTTVGYKVPRNDLLNICEVKEFLC